MARDIDDVVDPAGDPVVAVRVAAAAVAGEIFARIGAEIGVEEALVVAPDGAHLAGPAVGDAQIAACRALEHQTLGIDQLQLHAGQGSGRRARLQVGRARQGGDQNPAGLGLPPGVDDGAAALADDLMIPAPGLRIDRLADAAQQAQGFARRRLHRPVALAHQGPQGRGGGVEDLDLMLVDHLPEAAVVRIVGHALEHQGGRAIGQRAIDAIAVAGDPADIGGAPEDLARPVVEHQLMGPGHPEQIAPRGVQHPLGLTRRARGVEDEQRVLGLHGLAGAVGADAVPGLIVADIAALDHRDVGPGVGDDQHGLDDAGPRPFEGGIDIGLERHPLAAAQALVGGDDDLRAAVLDPSCQTVGREAAEDHGMDGADAGAGQHGHGRRRDHRQIQGDPVALHHAEAFEHIGHAADFGVEFPIGQAAGQGRLVALPEDGGVVATGLEMPVEAVVRDIQHPVCEPADPEIGLVEGDVLDVRRRREPVQPPRLFGPEGVGGFAGGDAGGVVSRTRHPRALRPFGRDGVKVGIAHGEILDQARTAASATGPYRKPVLLTPRRPGVGGWICARKRERVAVSSTTGSYRL